MNERGFDVIVYGSTGYTGGLIAEYLAAHGAAGGTRWAMAGRDAARLEATRQRIGASKERPLVIADAFDPSSLRAMVRRTRVVISSVGPYQSYGEPLLAACADAGTEYVDLCGEPTWMAAMIPRYDAAAKASGARIVFSCGFDSIPFDLGVYFLQRAAREKLGAPCPRVRARVRRIINRYSGGTVSTALVNAEAAGRDAGLATIMADPYALVTDPPEARQPAGDAVMFEADVPGWSVPFTMAGINTKNVHRSNALMGYAYGRDFTYDEMQWIGSDPRAQRRAKAAFRQALLQERLLGSAFARAVLLRMLLPRPGRGPTPAQRQRGSCEILFVGTASDGKSLRASVSTDQDPGYGSTSGMISEAAMCMARDVPRDRVSGGIWTPASAMGDTLLPRLERAGVRFRLEG